jgi:hypothetical protein
MRSVVVAGIAITLFGLLAYPLLTEQFPFQSDLGRYHLPIRDFYQKCLHNGDDPHWCPQLFCGFDVHGEGQGGFDHPWHRLLYRFVPLVPAFNIEVFSNYPLLCWGMYLFLRRHNISRESSFIGALWFTFSGFTIPHYSHTNAVAIIAHIPWLLWATDVQFTTTCPRRRAAASALIALLTGSQLLLGYPQYVLFSGIAESLYVFLLILCHRTMRPFGWWLVAKLIGLAIGGAQWLPTYQSLQLSPRMGYDKHFRAMGSLPWTMLLQSVTPTLFNPYTQMHEYTVYAGMLATFAGLWWVIRKLWRRVPVMEVVHTPIKDFPKALGVGRPANDLVMRWACWLAVIGLALAMGNNSPLYSLYVKLPVVGVFRFPCRYLVLFHLAAAVVVARFWDRLRECSDRPMATKNVLLGLLVPIIALVVAFRFARASGIDNHSPQVRAFLSEGSFAFVSAGIALVIFLLISCVGTGVTRIMPVLLLVAFADVTYFNFRTLDLPPLHRIGIAPTNTYQFVDLATFGNKELQPPQPTSGRVDVPDYSGNGLIMFGYKLARGYVGLSPPKLLNHDTIMQRLAGTQWQFDGAGWNAIDGLPLARLVTQVQATTDPKRDIENIDITTTALVAEPLSLEPGEPGTATIVEERPGRWTIAVNSPTKQLLVIAQSFHPSWRATIGGQPASIWRVNGDFQGIVVPAGAQEIQLTFDSLFRHWGRWLSWTGLSLAIAIGLLGGMLDRQRPKALR